MCFRCLMLEKSNDNLPYCIVLLEKTQTGIVGKVVGHSRLCKVYGINNACFVESGYYCMLFECFEVVIILNVLKHIYTHTHTLTHTHTHTHAHTHTRLYASYHVISFTNKLRPPCIGLPNAP